MDLKLVYSRNNLAVVEYDLKVVLVAIGHSQCSHIAFVIEFLHFFISVNKYIRNWPMKHI